MEIQLNSLDPLSSPVDIKAINRICEQIDATELEQRRCKEMIKALRLDAVQKGIPNDFVKDILKLHKEGPLEVERQQQILDFYKELFLK